MEYIVNGINVVIEDGEDGYFIAHVPSLKSCWSQGKTKEEALANIQEAMELHLEVLEERGEAVPEEYRESR